MERVSAILIGLMLIGGVIALSHPGGVGNATATGCHDSDGGKEFYYPGEISIGGRSIADQCHGQKLAEMICGNYGPDIVFFDCPDGCDSGACVKKEALLDEDIGPFTFDEMTTDTYWEVDGANVTIYHFHYNEDEDTVANVVQSPAEKMNGAWTLSLGLIARYLEPVTGDSLELTRELNQYLYHVQAIDQWNGLANHVELYLWRSGNRILMVGAQSNGSAPVRILALKFLQAFPSDLIPQKVCMDSDGNVNGWQGTVTFVDTTITTKQDMCISDTQLQEYYCSEGASLGLSEEDFYGNQGQLGDNIASTVITCDHGCSYGACNPAPCTDTDGEDYFTKGVSTYGGYNNSDICRDTTTLYEYYCSPSGYQSMQNVACAFGCEDGACVKPMCALE